MFLGGTFSIAPVLALKTDFRFFACDQSMWVLLTASASCVFTGTPGGLGFALVNAYRISINSSRGHFQARA